MVIAALT